MLHIVEVRKKEVTPELINRVLNFARVNHTERELLGSSKINSLSKEEPTRFINAILTEFWSLNNDSSVQRLVLDGPTRMTLHLITDNKQNKLVLLILEDSSTDPSSNSIFIGYQAHASFVNIVYPKLGLSTNQWRYVH